MVAAGHGVVVAGPRGDGRDLGVGPAVRIRPLRYIRANRIKQFLHMLQIAINQIYESTRVKVRSLPGLNHTKMRRHSDFVIHLHASALNCFTHGPIHVGPWLHGLRQCERSERQLPPLSRCGQGLNSAVNPTLTCVLMTCFAPPLTGQQTGR